MVAEIEYNVYDQKLAQEAISNGKRECIRTTFKELRNSLVLDESGVLYL